MQPVCRPGCFVRTFVACTDYTEYTYSVLVLAARLRAPVGSRSPLDLCSAAAAGSTARLGIWEHAGTMYYPVILHSMYIVSPIRVVAQAACEPHEVSYVTRTAVLSPFCYLFSQALPLFIAAGTLPQNVVAFAAANRSVNLKGANQNKYGNSNTAAQ